MVYDLKKILLEIEEVLKWLPYFEIDDLMNIVGVQKKFRTSFFYHEIAKYLKSKGYKQHLSYETIKVGGNAVPFGQWFIK